MAGVSNSYWDKNIRNISIEIKNNIIKIFLCISTYIYYLILKDLIITNKDDENVICVIVICKIILYFITQFSCHGQLIWLSAECLCISSIGHECRIFCNQAVKLSQVCLHIHLLQPETYAHQNGVIERNHRHIVKSCVPSLTDFGFCFCHCHISY